MRRFLAALLLISFIMPAHAAKKTSAPKLSQPAQSDNSNTENHDNAFVPLKAGEFDDAYAHYTTGNYLLAFYKALRRAEQGDPTAQTLLGQLYMEGHAVALDGARAALWFSRAAENGDPQAQLRYGMFLYNGTYVTSDPQKGIEYVRKAAMADVPEAFFYYGQLLLQSFPQDDTLDVALQWFLKGAAKDRPDASYAAAQILAHGTTKKPADYQSARRLLEAASAQSNVAAQVELAGWMVQGKGGPRNYDEAFHLLKTNAAQGYPSAQINLARLYRDGLGTDGDIVMAAAWYKVAQFSNLSALDLDSMLLGMSDDELKQADSHAARLTANL